MPRSNLLLTLLPAPLRHLFTGDVSHHGPSDALADGVENLRRLNERLASQSHHDLTR